MPDNHEIATVNRKGLLPKLSGSASDVLLGTGTFGSAPAVSFPLLGPDGSVGAPTYSFSSDTNTGIYRITTDTLGIATAGAEAWRILSTGTLRGPDAATSTSAGADRTIQGSPGGSVSGSGGTLNLLGGTTNSGAGGHIVIQGGSAVGNLGGQITIQCGPVTSGGGTGGGLSVLGGSVIGAGNGGSVDFSSGDGGTTSGDSGAIVFVTGSPVNGNSGAMLFLTRGGAGSNKNGGDIVFQTGAKTGSGASGNFDFTPAGVLAFRISGESKHVSHMGTSPTITSGGGTSPSIVGKDQAFTVTIGTGGVATTFTVTFANAFTNAPVATANSDTDIVALKVATTTTTVIVTATAPFTAGSKVHVNCGSWE